jgi:hypothetical protein
MASVYFPRSQREIVLSLLLYRRLIPHISIAIPRFNPKDKDDFECGEHLIFQEDLRALAALQLMRRPFSDLTISSRNRIGKRAVVSLFNNIDGVVIGNSVDEFVIRVDASA